MLTKEVARERVYISLLMIVSELLVLCLIYILFAIGEGAFAVYLEPWHADIFEFLELRKNHGKVPSRDHSLSYNIIWNLSHPLLHYT